MDMHSAIRSVARSVDLDREQMNSVMRIVMQAVSYTHLTLPTIYSV